MANMFSPTPPPLPPQTLSSPSLPPKRLGSAPDDEPSNKHPHKRRDGIYVEPREQPVPLMARAEADAAQLHANRFAKDDASDSASDDVFQDAQEVLGELPTDNIMQAMEGLFGLSQQEAYAMGLMNPPRQLSTPPVPRYVLIDGSREEGMGRNVDQIESEQPGHEYFSSGQNIEQENQEDAKLRSGGILQEEAGEMEAPILPEEVPVNGSDGTHSYEKYPAVQADGTIIDLPEDEEADEIASKSDHEDLHEKYFGKSSSAPDDDQSFSAGGDDDEGESLIIAEEKHADRRLSTPPLSKFSSPSKKVVANTRRSKLDRKYAPRSTYVPDINLDVSEDLIAHGRFHFRVAEYIPRIANQPQNLSFDWNRRYWIAVLLPTKQPRNAHSERDFIWMKGSRLTSVRTVWNAFLTTTFQDPDEGELMLGRHRVTMRERMEELDLWADHLVVFRLVRRALVPSESRALLHGLERYDTGEVIEIEDD